MHAMQQVLLLLMYCTTSHLVTNACGLPGGWFHTGDQGFLDEEGFLTLTGRIKELINRGGEKISPIEVGTHCCSPAYNFSLACVSGQLP